MNGQSAHRFVWAGLAAALLLLVFYSLHRGSTPEPSKTKPNIVQAAAETNGNVAKRSVPEQGNGAAARAAALQVGSDGTVAIPARFQLPGVRVAKSGVNSKDWLAQYSPDQQAKILAFNQNHFGLYQVNSREQVAWMAENGYPMPEDVIAAEKLSDTDLRELAKYGNDKAGFLLRERNAGLIKAKLDEYRAQGKIDTDFWANDPAAQQLQADDLATTELLDHSHSPYKGYVKAVGTGREENQLAKDIEVIAGLEWAQRLGDFRASQFLNSYIQGNPNLEAMALVASTVSGDAGTDSILMSTTGCQNAGTPPGMFVPGDFAPVE